MISLSYAASIAQASYATLDPDNREVTFNQLFSAGLSSYQIRGIIGSIEGGAKVLHHYSDPAGETGFSVSVFSQGNTVSIAFRGTDGGLDYNTDAILAAHGAGFDQIVAMYNWWVRATTTPGAVDQYVLIDYPINAVIPDGSTVVLQTAGSKTALVKTSGQATGELYASISGGMQVDVTGHSLGGHLAMAFATLFPSKVSSVTTFNAPGFDDNGIVREFFGALGGVVPTPQSIGDITTNVIANAGTLADPSVDIIAGLHSRPGEAVNIIIENQVRLDFPNASLNHSIKPLTDTVALYSTLKKLDANLTLDAYLGMVKKSSDTEISSLENLLFSVARSIGLPVSAIDGTSHKDLFYGMLNQVDDAVSSQAIVLSFSAVSGELAGQARSDFSSFLALYDLTPYTLSVPANATWQPGAQQARSALYAAWLADQDPALITKNFSDQWLTDRAALLRVQTVRNEGNQSSYGVIDPLGGPGQATLYRHNTNGVGDQVQTGALAGRIQRPEVVFSTANSGFSESSTPFGSDGRAGDRVYGGMGNDSLLGKRGPDRLEGGAGQDTLEGGAGMDTLIGGPGTDFYIYRLGDGNDVIHAFGKTVDDRDFLRLKGIHSNEVTYQRSGDDLHVIPPGGVIVVKDWFKGPEYQLRAIEPEFGFASSNVQINDRISNPLLTNHSTVSRNVASVVTQVQDATAGKLQDSSSFVLAGLGTLGDADLARFGVPASERTAFLDPEHLKGRLAGVHSRMTSAPSQALVVGLDGTEPEVVSSLAGAMFDFDGNGFRESTTWIAPESGLFVVDVNGNGLIDNGSEFVSNASAHQANGAISLQSLDSNQDGVVDGNDAAWSQLRIWADADQDGVSASHELLSMEIAGITSIALAAGDASSAVVGFSNGTQGIAEAVELERNTPNSIATQKFTPTAAIQALPNVTGMGDLHEWHQAMIRDPQLASLVTTFKNGSWEQAERSFDAVLAQWTGVNAVAVGSRGPNIDAKQVAALERFYGQKFAPTSNGSWQPDAQEAVTLRLAYAAAKERIQAEAMMQTHLAPYFSATSFTMSDSGEFEFDFVPVAQSIQALLTSDPDKGIWVATQAARVIAGLGFAQTSTYADFADAIVSNSAHGLDFFQLYAAGRTSAFGSVQADIMQPSEHGQLVFGLAGNDSITGGAGDDYLSGGAGNDTVNGGAGVNTLHGGAGDDTLTSGAFSASAQNSYIGGKGNDTMYGTDQGDLYIFNKGDGQDTIYEAANADAVDVLRFGAGISEAQTSTYRSGNDLVISFQDSTQDQITVKGWFTNVGVGNRLERIEFADGTVWTADEASSRPRILIGTDAGESLYGLESVADVIYGRGGSDNISGYSGNDRLYGEEGNDTLNGGAGDDFLSGGAGDDYLYGGAGDDVLEGDEGDDYLHGGAGFNVLRGGAGRDTLTADSSSTNVFEGGEGNDIITGSSGADTYIFALGDGHDTITEASDSAVLDVLRFGTGVDPADIKVSRSGTSLVLAHVNGQDSITFKNWYGSYYRPAATIERTEFADGTVWTGTDLTQLGLTQYAGPSGSFLTGLDESWNTLYGGQGNDDLTGGYMGRNDLYGGGGNDVLWGGLGAVNNLDGGAGNDVLYAGSSGTNVLNGGVGNDRLEGATYGSTTFIGGQGDDILRGTSAADLYIFNKGDGHDQITGSGRALDTVRFGAGIVAGDLSKTQSNRDLVLSYNDGADSIRLVDWYSSAAYQIGRFEFDDGSTVTGAELNSWSNSLRAAAVVSQQDVQSESGAEYLLSTKVTNSFDLPGASSNEWRPMLM